MKRRTNLFYTSGPDSKFLTFSNYTEALTGNVISTDTKLFPSKFLCLKINNLNSTNKHLFIDFLSRYYENKLATIKDNLIESNNGTIENLYPLSYLLEAICYITNVSNNELNFTAADMTAVNLQNFNFSLHEAINMISYIGDISEEDYNGTYTDIICCIDMNSFKQGKIMLKSNDDLTIENSIVSDDPEMLHGWRGFIDVNDNSFNENKNWTPIFDDSTSSYDRLNKIEKLNISIDEISDKLEFNVIIPLFDIVDINYNTNNTTIVEYDEEHPMMIQDAKQYDLPLGIWLYADKEEDTFITLEKDLETGMFPSWSLLISTQFKPFPYSNKIVNNANSSLLGNSFSTFAEVLTRMNLILDKFTQIESSINSIRNEIEELKNNGFITSGINDLNQKIDAYKKASENDILELENKMLSYISNLRWSSVG